MTNIAARKADHSAHTGRLYHSGPALSSIEGRGYELIEEPCEDRNMDGAVECHERLGGVLKHYRRTA